MELLSAAAIIELAKVQKKLLLEERVAVNKAGWLKDVLHWCNEHEIDLGDEAPRKFWITKAGIASIEHWLALHGQGTLQSQAQSRLGERTEVTSSNEKIAKIKPMQHRVLCVSCNLDQRLNQQYFFHLVDTPKQIISELEYTNIDLTYYDYLVVIENRDSFTDWHRFIPFIKGLINPLVIYRGHEKKHSKGCKALKARWREIKGDQGLVYFGDADIAGLGIAIAGEVPYQHLLLPEMRVLTAKLDPAQVNSAYDYARRNIDKRLFEKWHGLYSMLNQKAALRQQNMFNLPLVLY